MTTIFCFSSFVLFLGVIFLHEASAQKRSKRVTCVVCAGDKSNSVDEVLQRCSEYRKILRKTYKNKFNDMLKEAKKDPSAKAAHFFKECSKSEEECYNLKAEDKRILGFEEKGCGVGPDELPAEPYEGCTYGNMTFYGEEVAMLNCVCDNKQYCNSAWKQGMTPGILLFTTVLILWLR